MAVVVVVVVVVVVTPPAVLVVVHVVVTVGIFEGFSKRVEGSLSSHLSRLRPRLASPPSVERYARRARAHAVGPRPPLARMHGRTVCALPRTHAERSARVTVYVYTVVHCMYPYMYSYWYYCR